MVDSPLLKPGAFNGKNPLVDLNCLSVEELRTHLEEVAIPDAPGDPASVRRRAHRNHLHRFIRSSQLHGPGPLGGWACPRVP